MTDQVAVPAGETYRVPFDGSLQRPRPLIWHVLQTAFGLAVSALAVWMIVGLVPLFPGAVRTWWSAVGSRSFGGEVSAFFNFVTVDVVVPLIITVVGFGALWDEVASFIDEAPLRRVGDELVAIRELTRDGIGYREGETVTVTVPWSQVRDLRSMDVPPYLGKVFFVVELESPIHGRSRLVFWDGQDRHGSIAGSIRERLAASRAAAATA